MLILISKVVKLLLDRVASLVMFVIYYVALVCSSNIFCFNFKPLIHQLYLLISFSFYLHIIETFSAVIC